MTAIVTASGARSPWPYHRIRAAVRVHLANWPMALGFPWGILGASFVINVAIFSVIGSAVENATTGGLISIYIVQFIVCWQGLFQNFTFTVGLNSTRRAFYAATLLVAAGQSLLYAVALYVFAIIERATGGWGVEVRFFDPVPITHDGSPSTILVYFVPLLLASAAGLCLGAVGKRWGANGVFVLAVLLILLVGGAVALTFALDGWPAVGAWLSGQSGLALVAGWPLIPTALMAAGGWLVLRRAVP